MSTSMRLATRKDAEALFQLMRQMQEDDPWSEAFDESAVRSNVLELLQNPMYGIVYMVQDREQSIGYVAICFDYSLEYRGKGAWIDELFVARSHREHGIGAQLLEMAESASAKHHAKYLHLEVSHGNPAIELYRRHGFVDHQRYLMTKRIGE
jgi:diamine N-acetyltransferase